MFIAKTSIYQSVFIRQLTGLYVKLNFYGILSKTMEKLRKYPGFEDVQEGEAEEHINFIKMMARVLFDIYQNEQKNEPIKS